MKVSILTVDDYLDTLRGVVESLSPRKTFRESLQDMLSVLTNLHFQRPHIIVQDPESGNLRLSLFHGQADAPSASYAPGKGITGQVFTSGRPIIVPCMLEQQEFENRLFGRSKGEMAEMAFICVPVRVPSSEGSDVVGVLSVDTARTPDDELARRCRFLETVAELVARQVAWLQEDMARQHFRAMTEKAETAIPLGSAIISDSKAMRHVQYQIGLVAPSRATVLLRGESGVGKELMARALHEASDRSQLPLVQFNCAAMPAELIEGELFGWRKGAFTGAIGSHNGLFRQADKGTLFLDEIGDLSLSAQAKLLRVLQEGEVQALGSEHTETVDVRLICATNRSLEQLVDQGLFRQDFYYRINTFPIFIPALRERPEDIPPLAQHYLELFAREYGHAVRRISTPAMDMLRAHSWPGNVRELKNVIERAVLLCDEKALRVYHLPSELQREREGAGALRERGAGFTATVEQLEKDLIVEALRNARGNIHQAARDLGLTYRILHYKIHKYGLDYRQYLP